MLRLLFLATLWLFSFLPANAQVGLFVRPDATTFTSPVTNQTYWFSTVTGQIYVWNGTAFVQITPPFSNLAGSGPPTTSNDQTQGYQVGSIWFDATNKNFYSCTNPGTGGAKWDLFAGDSYSLTNLNLKPFTSDLTSGNFIATGIVPPTSSNLTTTLPTGRGYVNGSTVALVNPVTYTYTANSWTFDFLTSTGTISHYAQSIGSTPPVVANGTLSHYVVTGASSITSVVPVYVTNPVLDTLLASPAPSTANLTLYTATNAASNIVPVWGALPPAAISTAGAATGQVLQFNGTSYGPASITYPPVSVSLRQFGGNGQFGAASIVANTTETVGSQHQFTGITVGSTFTWTVQYGAILQASTSSGVTINGTLTGGTNGGGPSRGANGLYVSGASAYVSGGGGGGNGGTGGSGQSASTDAVGTIFGGLAVPIGLMQSSAGGVSSSGTAGAGGAVITIESIGPVSIPSGGIVNCNGGNAGNYGGGGGSGGIFACYSQASISNLGSITANGGTGGGGNSTSIAGGGGGAGGYALLVAPIITNTGVCTVALGSGGGGGNGTAGIIYQVTVTPYVPLVTQLKKQLPVLTALARIDGHQHGDVIMMDDGILKVLASTEADPQAALASYLGATQEAQTCGGENANADRS